MNIRLAVSGLAAVMVVLAGTSAMGQRVRFPSEVTSGGDATAPPVDAADSAASHGWQSAAPATVRAAAYQAPAATVAQAPGPYGSPTPTYAPAPSAAPAPGARLDGTIQAAPAWDPYAAPGSCPPAAACPPAACPPTACPPYVSPQPYAPAPYFPPMGQYNTPWTAYGEFLYLQPLNADVLLAAPTSGNGSFSVVNPNWGGGVRLGLGRQISDSSSISGSFTQFESNTNVSAGANAGDSLRSLTFLSGFGYQNATSTDYLRFRFADINYVGALTTINGFQIDYLIGGRYVNQRQAFDAEFTTVGRDDRIDTGINFDGGGIRIGLQTERISRNTGLLVFAKGSASFAAGQFTVDRELNFGGVHTDQSGRFNRVVPIMDLELGVGWINPTGNIRLTAGYEFSAWYNMITTSSLLAATQNPAGLGIGSLPNDTLTFDGLTIRMEVKF